MRRPSNIELEVKNVLGSVINPVLERDHGSATFVRVEDGLVTIRMEGACATCPSVQSTLQNVITAELKKAIPEVKGVMIDTTLDDEFYEIAKRLLKK